jgi:hypothetical protein
MRSHGHDPALAAAQAIPPPDFRGIRAVPAGTVVTVAGLRPPV